MVTPCSIISVNCGYDDLLWEDAESTGEKESRNAVHLQPTTFERIFHRATEMPITRTSCSVGWSAKAVTILAPVMFGVNIPSEKGQYPVWERAVSLEVLRQYQRLSVLLLVLPHVPTRAEAYSSTYPWSRVLRQDSGPTARLTHCSTAKSECKYANMYFMQFMQFM